MATFRSFKDWLKHKLVVEAGPTGPPKIPDPTVQKNLLKAGVDAAVDVAKTDPAGEDAATDFTKVMPKTAQLISQQGDAGKVTAGDVAASAQKAVAPKPVAARMRKK